MKDARVRRGSAWVQTNLEAQDERNDSERETRLMDQTDNPPTLRRESLFNMHGVHEIVVLELTFSFRASPIHVL